MSSRGFLDHLLGQVQQTLRNTGLTEPGSQGGTQLSGFGKGALAGTAIGLLLGKRSMRRLATIGGLGALGVFSYNAYAEWKRSQQAASAAANPISPPAAAALAPAAAPEEAEATAVLRALIAAAKADGHIAPRERELIEQGLAQLGEQEGLRSWFEAELAKPLDPAEVAAAAETPELAAEIYLASRLVIDEPGYMERSYLDELARQLKLEPGLREHLDQQAAARS